MICRKKKEKIFPVASRQAVPDREKSRKKLYLCANILIYYQLPIFKK